MGPAWADFLKHTRLYLVYTSTLLTLSLTPTVRDFLLGETSNEEFICTTRRYSYQQFHQSRATMLIQNIKTLCRFIFNTGKSCVHTIHHLSWNRNHPPHPKLRITPIVCLQTSYDVTLHFLATKLLTSYLARSYTTLFVYYNNAAAVENRTKYNKSIHKSRHILLRKRNRKLAVFIACVFYYPYHEWVRLAELVEIYQPLARYGKL